MKFCTLLTLVLTILAAPFLLLADASGTWELQFLNFNQGNVFNAMDAADADVIVASGVETNSQGGQDPVVKRSINGGTTWNAVQIPTNGGLFPAMFTEIQMINKDIGFAVGSEFGFTGSVAGPAWKITGMGATWEPLVTLDANYHPMCSHIFCLNETHCWLTCLDGEILYTANGGTSFSSATISQTDLEPGPIHFIDENHGWAAFGLSEGEDDEPSTVLNRGTIYSTSNGGVDWQQLTTDQPYVYYQMDFVNTQVGYLSASDDNYAYLLKTSNGGVDWFVLPLPSEIQGQFGTSPLWLVSDLKFFDENTGWVAVSYGTQEGSVGNTLYMKYTENGGLNWFDHQIINPQDSSAIGGHILDFDFIDEHLAFAAGEMQVIAKYEDGQYVPPDGDSPTDGDGVTDGDGSDGDVDQEKEPLYHGGPGEPCPIPGSEPDFDIQRCDAEKGSPLCAWRDSAETFCTAFCQKNEDCRPLSADAQCKPVTLEGQSKHICLLKGEYITDYSGDWYGYWRPLLGETCADSDPLCDLNYTGKICINEPSVTPFCSTLCLTDDDCLGGFIETVCCNGNAGGGQLYCRYGDLCEEPEPTDGDGSTDGDSNTDGDSPIGPGPVTDGDDGGSSEDGGSSGCMQSPETSMLLFGLLALSILFIRRKARI